MTLFHSPCYSLIAIIAASLGLPTTSVATTPPAKIVSQMRALKPLPKVHYSWPIPNELLEQDDNSKLYEYVRITHAVTLSGEWCNESRVEKAVQICHRVNQLDPSIDASVSMMYSPWHRRFGKKLPPTDEGNTCEAELKQFSSRTMMIKQWLALANKKYGANILLTAVLLDSERFHTRASDGAWNDAITKKYDQFHEIAKLSFPSAKIEWYGRGMRESAAKSGWSPHSGNTFSNKASSFSCSLYRVPEIGVMRETLRRTLALAKKHNVDTVTPWVALGAGYRRQVDQFQKWEADWDYDLVYSWIIGAELNRRWFGDRPARFMPGNAALVIVFYPAPFDPRTPSWGKHFVAYINGATGVKSLRAQVTP